MVIGPFATFPAEKYDRMMELESLTAEDKIELLENYLVLKKPETPDHDCAVELLGKRLVEVLPAGWFLRLQDVVALADSRPEPDIAVCHDCMRRPTPADVGPVIEVANSSLLRDQQDKARIYARGTVPVYWIVNLEDRRVEVHTQPSGPCDSPAYASVVHFSPGDSVPLVLDGATVATIPVADLLP